MREKKFNPNLTKRERERERELKQLTLDLGGRIGRLRSSKGEAEEAKTRAENLLVLELVVVVT